MSLGNDLGVMETFIQKRASRECTNFILGLVGSQPVTYKASANASSPYLPPWGPLLRLWGEILPGHTKSSQPQFPNPTPETRPLSPQNKLWVKCRNFFWILLGAVQGPFWPLDPQYGGFSGGQLRLHTFSHRSLSLSHPKWGTWNLCRFEPI